MSFSVPYDNQRSSLESALKLAASVTPSVSHSDSIPQWSWEKPQRPTDTHLALGIFNKMAKAKFSCYWRINLTRRLHIRTREGFRCWLVSPFISGLCRFSLWTSPFASVTLSFSVWFAHISSENEDFSPQKPQLLVLFQFEWSCAATHWEALVWLKCC